MKCQMYSCVDLILKSEPCNYLAKPPTLYITRQTQKTNQEPITFLKIRSRLSASTVRKNDNSKPAKL